MVVTPIRTCIGCRGKFPKKSLLRFACDSNRSLRIDLKGKFPGRGAYVCRSQACIDAAFRSPKIVNAHLRVNLSKGAIDLFKQEFIDLASRGNVEEV